MKRLSNEDEVGGRVRSSAVSYLLHFIVKSVVRESLLALEAARTRLPTVDTVSAIGLDEAVTPSSFSEGMRISD